MQSYSYNYIYKPIKQDNDTILLKKIYYDKLKFELLKNENDDIILKKKSSESIHPKLKDITRYHKCDILQATSYNNINSKGFDKNISEDEIILKAIEYNCPVIVKNGHDGKWYLKGHNKKYEFLQKKINKNLNKSRDGVYCLLLDIKQDDIININSIDDLKKYNFLHSKIMNGLINSEIITTNLPYIKLVLNTYKVINDADKIYSNKQITIKIGYCKDKHYLFLEELGISICRMDANNAVREVCNQCKINKIKLNLLIKLQDNRQIVIDL
tara:strand:+ start:617 stop:1426 length:810 start_codon:yes stop_codon:yes gene_type:complete